MVALCGDGACARRLKEGFLPSLGVEIRWMDMSDTKAVEEAFDDKTRGVFSELLANLSRLTVLDIQTIKKTDW